MSATPLSDIQEIIERSLFESIRQEVVDKGYLPDISDTGTYPDNDTGWTQWETDLSAIVSSKGFAIEVFSGGASESRGVKKLPRIVMESGNFLPGALGGDPRRFFSDQGSDFQAKVTPPQTTDFYIYFCLVSDDIEQARILNAILALSVPRRGYIPWYNDSTKSFFARYLNYFDRSDDSDGIIEHVYAYEIPDAWDHDDIEQYATIAKMTEITLNTNVQKYMDRTWGYDSDSLVVTSYDYLDNEEYISTFLNRLPTLSSETKYYADHFGNGGLSAEDASSNLTYLKQFATFKEHDLVVITLGANDLLNNKTASQLKGYVDTIISELSGVLPNAEFLVLTPNYALETTGGDDDQDYIDEVNNYLELLKADTDMANYDMGGLFGLFSEAVENGYAENGSNLIHPNTTGYQYEGYSLFKELEFKSVSGGNENNVRVLFIGDSLHKYGVYLSDEIKSAYGDGGAGMVEIGNNPYSVSGLIGDILSGWTHYDQDVSNWGLHGSAIETSNSSATILISRTTSPVTIARLWYEGGSGSIDYRFSGGATTLTLDGTGLQYKEIQWDGNETYLNLENVSGTVKIYAIELLNGSDYWWGTNIVPQASSIFDTDGTSYWSGIDFTLSWDSGNEWMVATVSAASQRIQAAGLVATVGNTYHHKFRCKSPTIASQLLLGLSSYYNNITVIKDPTTSTDWQTYEFIGDTLYGRFYFALTSASIGEELHIDDIQIVDIT